MAQREEEGEEKEEEEDEEVIASPAWYVGHRRERSFFHPTSRPGLSIEAMAKSSRELVVVLPKKGKGERNGS